MSTATGWYRAGDDAGNGSIKLYRDKNDKVGGPRVDAPMGVDPSNDTQAFGNGYEGGDLNLTSATRTEARFARVFVRGGFLVYQVAIEKAALQTALKKDGGDFAIGCLP